MIDNHQILKNAIDKKKNEIKNPEQNEFIANQSKNKQIIANDLINENKILVEENLINKEEVDTGLKDEDVEYFREYIDVDLYKLDYYSFQNTPKKRLAEERRILDDGPQNMSGCRNIWARKRWYAKQRGRVSNAESINKKHEKLLASYHKFRKQKEKDISDLKSAITAKYSADERVQLAKPEAYENQQEDRAPELLKVSDMLKQVNKELTRDAVAEAQSQSVGVIKELKTFIKNYEFEVDEEKLENGKKKVVKTIKTKDDIKLKTEVKDLEGQKPMELKDLADLFKEVMDQGDKPFTTTEQTEKGAVEKNHDQTRYAEMKRMAEKLLEKAAYLQIDIPEEMYYLISVQGDKLDNPLLANGVNDFKPEKNAREAYVLLISAASQIYYEALNRYAGYNASDGLTTYHFAEDKERYAKNFDIFNKTMMTKVRNLRDTMAAYANEIRRNRLKIREDNTEEEAEKKDEQMKLNVQLLQNAQPSGNQEKEKEKEKIIEEDSEVKKARIYKEWEDTLKNDIRGTQAVNGEDMKQKPWVLKDYADQVLEIMKNTPNCEGLTGEPLKRYLIAINDNLAHNLKQLRDELPKTAVGAKFCYVPRLRNEFIESIIKDKFGLLLSKGYSFRDLLRNNSVLKDFFDTPKYRALKNRQREIMKAINESLGINFYNDIVHLKDLWANETIQTLLLSEPADKEEYEKKAEDDILKQEEKEQGVQGEKKAPKKGNILKSAIRELLSKSERYGVTDKSFTDAIAKIKATVHDNIAVIDRSIGLMGVCDTAKAVAKRRIIKQLGGEYLLGYNVIPQDIVEYTVRHMMAYRGHAAEVQKHWDRYFKKTGLPARLSNEIERQVASKVNAKGEKDGFYLCSKGFKSSKKGNNKWDETDKAVTGIINTLRDLYNKNIKEFLTTFSGSEDLRKAVTNDTKQYVKDKVRLKKSQWDHIEETFEEKWLEIFKDTYLSGTYSEKEVKEKLKTLKAEMAKEIDKELTANFRVRDAFGKDVAGKLEYEETLVTREEYTEGLKANPVIETHKPVVVDDIEKQIFGYPALEQIFKNKEDRAIFNKVLQDELKNEKSALHLTHPYLDDVRSIEQLRDLSLIDYSQFFADVKTLLTIPCGEQKDRILLDEWRLSGQGGGDIYGIKKKLLKDFFSGNMNEQVFTANLAKYKDDALKSESIEQMRFDAILHNDPDPSDQLVKFNYLNITGKKVNQTTRMKKIGYAQKLWNHLQNDPAAKENKWEEKLTNFLVAFFKNLQDKKKSGEAAKTIAKFGEILDNIKVEVRPMTDGPTKYVMDQKSVGKLMDSKLLVGTLLTNSDIAMLKGVQEIFAEVAKEDPSEKKFKLSECLGEILLFGCGREYFEVGGSGEQVFLNSDDNAYYDDIARHGNEIIYKRKEVQEALKFFKLPEKEAEQLMLRLKPVIAGLKVSNDPEAQAENLRKYGVKNTIDLIKRLGEIYGTDKKSKDNLAKSKELGAIYKARIDYIDNYGEGDLKGKFRIVRNYMMQDQETWNKVMTMSDADFVDFIKEQEKLYGKALDAFKDADFRASGPINEQYVMKYWDAFGDRSDWTLEQWKDDIQHFHDVFKDTAIQKKQSINKIMENVQLKMVKAGIDKSVGTGTLIMQLSYLLMENPSAFALLYNENDMFEAIKRMDKQYKDNMAALEDIMGEIFYADQTKKAYSDDAETDALAKEVASIFFNGKTYAEQRSKVSSTKKLQELEEKNKKEITDNSRLYADYNLLMQFMKPLAFSVSQEKFKDAVIQKLKDFRAAQQSERNANIYPDRTVLDTKDAVRLDLDIKKNRGRMMEREFLKDYVEYREQRAALGSIGLVAYKTDPRFDAKDIAKAKTVVQTYVAGDFGTADEEFIRGLLAERVLAYGLDKKKEDIKDLLAAEKMRLLSLDKALREEGKLTNEAEIQRAIVFAFAQNADRSKAPLDGTHEGDIKEILEEIRERTALIDIKRPKSAFAQRDYDEFMEEMDIAYYTMNKEQFKEVCEKKKRYYELVDACVEKISAASEKLDVQFGLFEYFKKDIYDAIKEEKSTKDFTKSVTDQLEELIGDKVKDRNGLKAEDIKRFTLMYLPDSGQLMQQVSNKTVTAEEKLFSSQQYTRADLEREIANSGKDDLVQMYNSLTLEEQKLFAIVLTFPDIGLSDNEALTSNYVLKDKNKETKRELELQDQVSAFLFDQDFAPKIDYNLAMRRLMKTDRKTGFRRVSVTMFKKAMQYTQYCSVKRAEMRPKDIEKLTDSKLTGQEGRNLSGLANKEPEVQKALETGSYHGPETFRDFVTKLAEEDGAKENKSLAKIAKRFGAYTNVQTYLLLHVLQDRTTVDYTTTAGKWSAFLLRGVGYVNGDRREQLKQFFRRPDGMDNKLMAELNRSVNNKMYQQAAQTLFSYQLRDDIEIKDHLSKSSFAKGALDRTTKVDWELLERAMDLVEEIEHDNLKIQLCRQTTDHTMDEAAPNKKAAALAKEIEKTFKNEVQTPFDFFNDFLAREAKKDPKVALPMLSAYTGLSENEKMLVIHALKHRDILDISTDNTFTTAIGMNENQYVNEKGRDRLADYYIDHLGVPGAKNVLATNQYDLRDAMRSLVSTQVSDARNPENKTNFADMMVGKKILNWVYVGGRSTGVDWELFGNALKFAKKTEHERKLFIGEAESYRAVGNIDKYGRFMYNYSYLRKNSYRSGYRLTRFIGRRIRAELEGAIPGYGFGQRIMMMFLTPKWRNKMLSTGIVKPGVSKNMTTDILGYAGIGGTTVSGVASALNVIKSAAQAGTAIAGESITQSASALTGIYNIVKDASYIPKVNKPFENQEELEKEDSKKRGQAGKYQTMEQALAMKDNTEYKNWMLGEVSAAAGTGALAQDILETATNCINVLSGSTFGIQALTNYFVGGIRAVISETLHTARFITSVCTDKKMMDKYFADNGPLGKEIKAIKDDNVQKIITDQNFRRNDGARVIMNDAVIHVSQTEFMGKMSNTELFRKAYGFKDFSEQASFVGWNIVQTLLQSASPFAVNVAQFMRASLLLAAIGCKDVIGKQDNESAQKVYNRLMGVDIR